MKKLHLVVNPVSGKGKSALIAPEVCSYFKSVGYDVKYLESKCQGDIRRITSEITNSSSIVAVMGGDGTVNEAVSGLNGSSNPVLVLAVGTANVIARELGIPTNPIEAAKIITNHKVVGWDTASAVDMKVLFSISAGFDAATVHKLSEMRTGILSSRFAYIPPALHTLVKHKHHTFKLTVDGKLYEDEFVYFLAMNTIRYAGGFKVMSEADTNDGAFNLLAVKKSGLLKYLEVGTRMMIGKLKEQRAVILTSFKELQATSTDKVPVQVDGDKHGFLPVNIRVQKSGCHFVVPAR